MNNPKALMPRVPLLPPGDYTLQITTRYSKTGQLLKEPRTLVYDFPLTVPDENETGKGSPTGAGQTLLPP